jgi:hypothetical protein
MENKKKYFLFLFFIFYLLTTSQFIHITSQVDLVEHFGDAVG